MSTPSDQLLFDVGLDSNDFLDLDTDSQFDPFDTTVEPLEIPEPQEPVFEDLTLPEEESVEIPELVEEVEELEATIAQEDTAVPTPEIAEPTVVEEATNVDEGQALQAEITANAAKVALERELAVAASLENQEQVVREALLGTGLDANTSDSYLKSIPVSLKNNIERLQIARLYSNAFNGRQQTAGATILRNVVALLFGNPYQDRVDQIQKEVDNDIKNFKGAIEVRKSLIEAVKDTNPVFTKARQDDLIAKAATRFIANDTNQTNLANTRAKTTALAEAYRQDNPLLAEGKTEQELAALAILEDKKEQREIQKRNTKIAERKQDGVEADIDAANGALVAQFNDRVSGSTLSDKQKVASQRAYIAQQKAKADQGQLDNQTDAIRLKKLDRQDDINAARAILGEKANGLTDIQVLAQYSKIKASKKAEDLKKAEAIEAQKISLEQERIKLAKREFTAKDRKSFEDSLRNPSLSDGLTDEARQKAARQAQIEARAVATAARAKGQKVNPTIQGISDGTITVGNSIGRAQVQGVFDVLTVAEAGEAGYNASVDPVLATKQVSRMTVGEILKAQQERIGQGSPAVAVGLGQFNNKTLREAVQLGAISEDQVFNRPAQDRLITDYIMLSGGKRYFASKKTDADKTAFINRLAKRWAGIPVASAQTRTNKDGSKTRIAVGQSYYKGVGNNKATIKLSQVKAAVDGLGGGGGTISLQDALLTIQEAKTEGAIDAKDNTAQGRRAKAAASKEANLTSFLDQIVEPNTVTVDDLKSLETYDALSVSPLGKFNANANEGLATIRAIESSLTPQAKLDFQNVLQLNGDRRRGKGKTAKTRLLNRPLGEDTAIVGHNGYAGTIVTGVGQIDSVLKERPNSSIRGIIEGLRARGVNRTESARQINQHFKQLKVHKQTSPIYRAFGLDDYQPIVVQYSTGRFGGKKKIDVQLDGDNQQAIEVLVNRYMSNYNNGIGRLSPSRLLDEVRQTAPVQSIRNSDIITRLREGE